MFGLGRAVRMATATWQPWKIYLLAGALVAAGVALAVAGIDRGGLAVGVIGVLLLVRALAGRGRRRARTTSPPPAERTS